MMRPIPRLSLLLCLGVLAACDPAPPSTPPDHVHRLAEQGATRPLIAAIAEDGRVDRRDVCYRTPLMLAAQFGRIETVEALLAAGAEVNLHEKGYYTALMLAAGNGHTAVVAMLADAGAALDEVEITQGWTALIWAAKRGHRSTVAQLLELGADSTRRDHQGRSARDWALIGQHQATADLFGRAAQPVPGS